MYKFVIAIMLAGICLTAKSQIWTPDKGDGTYKNPIIHADYSDPDVIRVGDDYYMVASSFNCQPGIPVLHSKDLVNWTIINHVYDRLPLQRYERVQLGQGSWAPSIRYHGGLFYVYFCTPEDGLFMATAKHPSGKWTLRLVQKVTNWEDPCPFWDDDGQAYLLRGAVGAGPAILHKMTPDGTRLLDNGKIIYRDDRKQPVLEGFKFMDKRDGYYYFSAPAGGVQTGWQSVFRSRNIYGPYEDKIILHQGNSTVNGPHQGGIVETQTGEWWFVHFQDKGFYGRIVHLQPVQWKNGWPVAGIDQDGDGTGEPVLSFKKPNVGRANFPVTVPQTDDDFSTGKLGLQWQWQGAPQKDWYQLSKERKGIRLMAISNPTDSGSLFYTPNLLLQKIPAPAFTVTTAVNFHPQQDGDRAGLSVAGNYFTFLCLEKEASGNSLVLYEGKRENRKFLMPKKLLSSPASAGKVWLRVSITEDGTCRYSYSLNGSDFKDYGDAYSVQQGTWIGAKVGLICLSPSLMESKGYADFEFFRFGSQR